MRVVPPTISEILWKQCNRLLMMNPLVIPAYYSTLFNTFASLLPEEDLDILRMAIKEIEHWLSDEHNQLTLHEAELRMYNNLDLLSGFLVNGQIITQMEINQKLEQIKQWLTTRLYDLMPQIRFTTPLRVD